MISGCSCGDFAVVGLSFMVAPIAWFDNRIHVLTFPLVLFLCFILVLRYNYCCPF